MENNWIRLSSVEEIEKIRQRSHDVPCLIFKHSTRCSISSIAEYRLNDDWDFSADELERYHLDLIRYRDISNAIADEFQVYHESPQALLIVNGECVYDLSHLDISVEDIREQLMNSVTQ